MKLRMELRCILFPLIIQSTNQARGQRNCLQTSETRFLHSCLLAGHLNTWPGTRWPLQRGSQWITFQKDHHHHSNPPGLHQGSSQERDGCSLDENLLQSALDLGWWFIFQKVTDPKHTAEVSQEWLQDNSANVLERASQNTDLHPLQHLWGGIWTSPCTDALHPAWWCLRGTWAQSQLCRACGIIFKKSWGCEFVKHHFG